MDKKTCRKLFHFSSWKCIHLILRSLFYGHSHHLYIPIGIYASTKWIHLSFHPQIILVWLGVKTTKQIDKVSNHSSRAAMAERGDWGSLPHPSREKFLKLIDYMGSSECLIKDNKEKKWADFKPSTMWPMYKNLCIKS